MTIFDTIRYPLSEPPTFKQLKTLPRSIYDEWIRKIYGEVTVDTIQIFYMATTLMQLYRTDDDLYHRRMKLLRRLIKDYDNL